eukprot:1920916-Amphidinium_carterae.1
MRETIEGGDQSASSRDIRPRWQQQERSSERQPGVGSTYDCFLHRSASLVPMLRWGRQRKPFSRSKRDALERRS